ncbi:MAG: hypothetical protein HKM89_15115 [Gemmatimonadales bacterium]|nr:hypothetical protein [Gemmatimonadales bacterium]
MFRRTYPEEADIAFSALDCVVPGESVVYASSPLTTGKRLYKLLERYGATDRDALKAEVGPEAVRRLVWDPNVDEATAFARRLRDALDGCPLVITPAPLRAPGWSQQEYYDFWGDLLRSRTSAAYFNHEWQYSNGCAYEFAVAKEAGIPTFDRDCR